MIFFIDASAIVKLYQRERGSDVVRALFADSARKGALFVSELIELEVVVRLAKWVRTAERRERRTARDALARYARLRVEQLNVVALEPGVMRCAEEIAHQFTDSGAGTLDLVHAASALQLQAGVRGRAVVFVAANRKLRSLADRIGLNTLNPETEPA